LLHRAGVHRRLRPPSDLDLTRKRRRARWALAAALAAPVALGAGCGSPGQPPGTAAPAATVRAAPVGVPAGSGVASPKLPLDPYLLSPPDSVRVARAYRLLLAECVRPFGLAGPPERADSGPVPPDLNGRRYGITDARLAAVAGFRVAVPQPASPQAPSPQEPGGSADPRMLTVLDGAPHAVVGGQPVPAGGCVGEAKRRLSAGAPAVTDPDLVQRFSQDSYFASQRDPRVRAAIGAWSACMRGHGYAYSSPLAAAGDPRFVTGPVTPTEIAVATADIACKARTGLVDAWSRVEAELERPQIAANPQVLDDIRRRNETQLRVARDLGLG